MNDILEISSKIWSGHDYLPQVIDEWIADPKSHTYGVEAEGRIVAVGNLRLVDNGKTGWMEGLRVHPRHRRRGYADMLTEHFVNLGQTLNVKRLRYSTGGNNRGSLRLAKKTGFKRLFKMSAFWLTDLQPDQSSRPTRRRIMKTTPLEIYELMKATPTLIPHNILVYDWKAVNATRLGYKEIAKDHIFYITKTKGKLTSFSLGHERRDSESATWAFTTYASDEQVFSEQFRYQINIAQKHGPNAVCACQTVFEDIVKEQSPKYTWKLQLIVLEKHMKPKIQRTN